MNHIAQIPLYWHTLQYISVKQWWYRGRRIIRQRYWHLTNKQIALPATFTLATCHPLFQSSTLPANSELTSHINFQIQAELIIANQAKRNEFVFLNNRKSFGKTIDWSTNEFPRLWRFNLHYFHVVFSLLIQKASGLEDSAIETFSRLADSWINDNQRLRGDGWHPYTLSLRIVNWSHALLSGLVEPAFKDKFCASLYSQARFLYHDLEMDIRGNHLLENLRALIFAGCLFDGQEAQTWLNKGLALLEKETKEQILLDGGHFERCPSYHLVMAKNYLETCLWLRRNGVDVPTWLDEALRRMLEFCRVVIPKDGLEPLLKDSAWDASPETFDILSAGALYFQDERYKMVNQFSLYGYLLFGEEGFRQFKDWDVSQESWGTWLLQENGYQIVRTPTSFFIMDVGYVCPPYLPGHAHADMFTYELHINGQRVVVDSGVYEYQKGEWRDFFRSTRAHNTIVVEEINQSEVWSSFRVAQRAMPTVHSSIQLDDYSIIQASHDGYNRLKTPVTHRRTCFVHQAGIWLFVDELFGSGHVNAANHIHFHPDLSLDTSSSIRWQIDNIDDLTIMSALADSNNMKTNIMCGEMNPKQGWYSEHFGKMVPNQVLCFDLSGELPLRFAYVITTRPLNEFVLSSGEHTTICSLKFEQETLRFCVPDEENPYLL